MSAKSKYPLYLLVFVVGAVSLGIEIAAARLIAPFFGASTVVWANTIAVVLMALSVGYWLGGRFADRYPQRQGLSLICLLSAAILGIVPFAATPFLEASVHALDTVSAGAFVGSLISVLVLVALPVMLLGAVAPYAIRLAARSVEESGTVAGRMYAISTVGSLFGTFTSALLLIPLIGTRRTFLTLALLLAVAALPGLRRSFLVVPALLAVAIVLPVGLVKAGSHGRVIYESETPYQYVRVVEDSQGRYLELNEGQATHSLYRFNSYLTGDYWDEFLVLPFSTHLKPPNRIAILGNAGGTTARAYGHYFPQTQVDAVEIDPELSRVGRRYFAMSNKRMKLYHQDARPFLRSSKQSYDMIAVDAYRQPYIPFYLVTQEFFKTARDRLRKHGVVVVNVGHPVGDNELEKVVATTVGRVFRYVKRDQVRATNTVLIASQSPIEAATIGSGRGLPKELLATAKKSAERLEPALTGGEAYSDDRAPVEWLIDRSIVRYAVKSP